MRRLDSDKRPGHLVHGMVLPALKKPTDVYLEADRKHGMTAPPATATTAVRPRPTAAPEGGSIMTTMPVPDPSPEEVTRGIAALERHLAAQAPPEPEPAPARPAEPPSGETKRVRQLREEVAEAHALAVLQDDDAPLTVETPKVRKRRKKAQEAARLYELAQDRAALAWRDQKIRRITTAMVMAAAGIALAVSSIGVQASVVAALHLTEGSAGWWAAFLVEPTLSLPLLATVAVQAYAAMRGQVVDRKSPQGRKLFRTEALLLGLTLVLNCWPAVSVAAFDPLALVVHSLGPVAAVTAIWVLPTLWSILAALPAGQGATEGATGRKYSANAPGAEGRSLAEHRTRLHALITAGQLPGAPSATAIRRALGCGTEIATQLRDELTP